ncbi:MAG: response regulator [Planctomycetota bacterium]
MVDDDVEFRRDACEALESAGYRTIAASNGRDAVQVLTLGRIRPSAVVLDVNMPEMDGVEFARWLNGQSSLRSIPVIVVSALLFAGSADLMKPAAVLMKPFSPADLLESVETAAS